MEGRKSKRAGLGAVISRWVMKSSIAFPEQDRQIIGLEIDDRDILYSIAIEIPRQPKVRTGISPGILTGSECRVAVSKKCREAVLLSVDDQ